MHPADLSIPFDHVGVSGFFLFSFLKNSEVSQFHLELPNHNKLPPSLSQTCCSNWGQATNRYAAAGLGKYGQHLACAETPQCIQDVPGVQLYTEVGTTTKGGCGCHPDKVPLYQRAYISCLFTAM